MKAKIKVKVSKTVQDAQYEPYTLEVSSEITLEEVKNPDELQKKINKLYTTVDNLVIEKINDHLVELNEAKN